MPRGFLIDPRARTVIEHIGIQQPNSEDFHLWEVSEITDDGDAIWQLPRTIFDKRIEAYILDYHTGLFLGRGVVFGKNFEPPRIPILALTRRVNWVSTIMVINGARCVIPRRPAL